MKSLSKEEIKDRLIRRAADTWGVDEMEIEYSFDPILSPRIGLSYQFNYKFSLFATVSHGFSPPSLSETLTPDGNINPSIQPEKGWNFEYSSDS